MKRVFALLLAGLLLLSLGACGTKTDDSVLTFQLEGTEIKAPAQRYQSDGGFSMVYPTEYFTVYADETYADFWMIPQNNYANVYITVVCTDLTAEDVEAELEMHRETPELYRVEETAIGAEAYPAQVIYAYSEGELYYIEYWSEVGGTIYHVIMGCPTGAFWAVWEDCLFTMLDTLVLQ